jgi:hypothetical protein
MTPLRRARGRGQAATTMDASGMAPPVPAALAGGWAFRE